ncbi:MAG: hypothetical protein NTX92_08335 [Euryarchaeota archaeon]|jgi:hypothetical protein|nr:hypothetical protein [Euryarchaeota archaeon]
MKNVLWMKGLTYGIILLFVSFSALPIIDVHIVKAYNNNDLVEVTTQICDAAGENSQIIQLTKEQVQEVKTIFNELKNSLSTAASVEETQRIFNDTIIELNRYNLLPKGMSIEHAQRLVNQVSTNQKRITSLKILSQKFQAETAAGTIQNSFCSIAGNTSNTHFAKLAKRTALRLYYIMDFGTGNAPLVKVATALWIVCNQISKISQMILRQNGYHWGVCIYFGNNRYSPYPNWLSPAQGWLSTNGINGKQNITGSFWGQKITSGWQPQDDWYMNYTWRGCVGFTGLILYAGIDSVYFLGSALHVNVGSDRP